MKWFSRKVRRRSGYSVRGFAAAETTRLLAGWKWDGGFSAQEISSQLATIRARSRECAKNSALFRRWLTLSVVNLVGEGFTFKSTPHDGTPGTKQYRLDEAAARFIEYHYWRFCNNRDSKTGMTWCDATGRKTDTQMDRLNAQTLCRDGEYFKIAQRTTENPYGITFRIVRPDCVDHTYNADLDKRRIVRCGVELDSYTMRPLAYYMRTDPAHAMVTTAYGPLVRVPASDVIHVFIPSDEDQPRGVPLGHASLVKLKMLDELDKSELTSAREDSITTRSYYAPKGDESQIADLTSDENSDVAQALTMEKEPGQAEILPVGWKHEVHTPQHPNRDMPPFRAGMIKDVAGGFGVEYSNFANDWAGVSFSSVRVGTISERDTWVMMQGEIIAQDKTPQFLKWLDSFLSLSISGTLPAEKFDKFAEHEIRGRRWLWVDPARDMAAAETARKYGWKTDSRIASELGADYEENVEEIKREAAVKAGTRLEREPTDGGNKHETPQETEARD